MDDYRFEVIDSSDKRLVESFERAFYKVFHEQKSDSWSDKHYVVDDRAGLIRHSQLAYEDIRFYGIFKGERLLGGASINLNTAKVVTLADMGGEIAESEAGSNFVEALNLFLLEDAGKDFFKLFMLFSELIFSDMKKLGFKYLYGKCPEKLVNMYGLVGFEEVGRFTFKDVPLCLLRADIELEG